VLAVDTENQVVEVEGMTTYESLVDACLKKHCMPLVVPQLKLVARFRVSELSHLLSGMVCRTSQ
jgi:hypothetical protein